MGRAVRIGPTATISMITDGGEQNKRKNYRGRLFIMGMLNSLYHLWRTSFPMSLDLRLCLETIMKTTRESGSARTLLRRQTPKQSLLKWMWVRTPNPRNHLSP